MLTFFQNHLRLAFPGQSQISSERVPLIHPILTTMLAALYPAALILSAVRQRRPKAAIAMLAPQL